MVRENMPLSGLTTMGVGGNARKVVFATSRAEAEKFLLDATLIGRGSNLIASDDGFDGTLLRLDYGGVRLTTDGVYADAGVPIAKVARFCLSQSLSGMEWAAGIPGTVGGAAIMNAGAFGSDTAAHTVYVDTFEKRLPPDACGFDYRTSSLSEVAGVCFSVESGAQEAIAARMQAFKLRRRATQPRERSAGSVFRKADLPAAVYIEQAGLKGVREGGAQVSDVHANFIVNTGSATAADVKRLIQRIKATVAERFNVRLVTEIRFLGEV